MHQPIGCGEYINPVCRGRAGILVQAPGQLGYTAGDPISNSQREKEMHSEARGGS